MKTPKSQMIERLVRIRKIGFRIGNVTSRKTRHGLAPSTSRRLDELIGTCASPAYTVTTTNGIAPQTISVVIIPSCENVVPYQSCCEKSPRWSCVRA